jgi:hypothetical protein
MSHNVLPSLVLVITLQATAEASDNKKWPEYGNPAEVAAIRRVVASWPGVRGVCTKWGSNKIVVIGEYALVGTACDFGEEGFWRKRGNTWAVVIPGKPGVFACKIRAQGVPQSTLVQLMSRWWAISTADVEKNLKKDPCLMI